MSIIVSPKWLKDRLENNEENTVIIDTRFMLNDPSYGLKSYKESHIPTAVFLDLDKDLSGVVSKHGGNHPLPEIESFVEMLGALGIDEQTTIVVYDQNNEMYAPRLWWMLHYLGHESVYLLDGGFKSWVDKGYKLTTEIPSPEKKIYTPNVRQDLVVHIDDVKNKLANSTATLIDSRANERYLGHTEPLYSKAGHIPGAKNFFWQDVLNESGSWKNTKQLEEHFSSLDKTEEIIVSCGSGVSACPNIIGLLLSGYTNVKLYPGGYSDWISYENNTVSTKEE